MSELEVLLTSLRPEIQAELRPRLHGLLGRFVRGYLPQVWAFRTELESASLTVSDKGMVRVSEGIPDDYDVLIRWSQKQLTAALRTRDKDQVPAGAMPSISFRTRRGKTAFSFLKARFGL
jgi:hypothetical protein